MHRQFQQSPGQLVQLIDLFGEWFCQCTGIFRPPSSPTLRPGRSATLAPLLLTGMDKHCCQGICLHHHHHHHYTHNPTRPPPPPLPPLPPPPTPTPPPPGVWLAARFPFCRKCPHKCRTPVGNPKLLATMQAAAQAVRAAGERESDASAHFFDMSGWQSQWP